MSRSASQPAQGAFASLQRLARKSALAPEICELCGAPLASDHDHLLEMERRKIACACRPCVILFDGGAGQRYRRIPREVRCLSDFAMDDQEWEGLRIPIKLAFFAYSSSLGRTVANYPSPGGILTSTLDLDEWDGIIARNPLLKKFAPDVETLLVNRITERPRYYRAPIDQCFRLAGIIRTRWRGLSGGSDVWREVDGFFHGLDQIAGGRRA